MNFLKFGFTFALISFVLSPAQAEFGVRFVANKRAVLDLNAAGKKISYRFTCQQDLSLVAASVFCGEAADSPSYLLSLQEDREGLPTGIPLSSSGIVPRSQSWSTVLLDEVPLSAGKVYHLVLEFDANRGGEHPVGRIGPLHHASFISTDVLNRLHPNEGTPDGNSNTLFFENGQWRPLNQEPVFAVHGRGFKFQGNPYDDPGVRPVHANGSPKDKSKQVLQGQVLHFRCGFAPKALVFRVRKQGNPPFPLNYQILKNDHLRHNVTLEFSDGALAPGQASSDWKWVTVGIKPEAHLSLGAECWYFAFQTDSGKASAGFPGCEDCYLLSDVGNSGGLAGAADLTFDSGAHLSRATRSMDGGSPLNWMDEFERDANVVVLGHDCPSSLGEAPAKSTPLPTPPPLEIPLLEPQR